MHDFCRLIMIFPTRIVFLGKEHVKTHDERNFSSKIHTCVLILFNKKSKNDDLLVHWKCCLSFGYIDCQ
jgi:hypothetical protein